MIEEVTIQKRRSVVPLIALVSLGIVGVVLYMVVPGFLRAGMSGNEASAIRVLRTINGAQKRYWERCHGYAGDLTVLQTTGALVLEEEVQRGSLTKNGYRVDVKPSTSAFVTSNPPGACAGSVTEYVGRADPVTVGTTGSRYFATDQRGTIYQSTNGRVIEPIEAATPVQ